MQHIKSYLKHTGIAVMTLLASSTNLLFGDAISSKPNIILLFADDLGYTDISYENRSDFYETPNIDRFAEQSLEFTNGYASHPTCGPSRLGIMTGKYPARLGVICNDVMSSIKTVPTLAERLKANGYTTAHIGKWHLGNGLLRPDKQGFDLSIASNSAGMPASFHYPFKNKNRSNFDVPDLEGYGSGDHLTDCITDKAIEFIQQNKSKPFFLYQSYYAVHTPIEANAEKVAKYKAKLAANPGTRHNNPTYAGLIEHLDDSVGRILKALETEGIADNTIVIFFSDNGGTAAAETSNYPLRSFKASLYEGGTRVPVFVRWPGATTADSKCDVPVIGHDLYPTILSMAGGTPDPNNLPDGVDISSLMKDPSGTLSREALHWLCYPKAVHYKSSSEIRFPMGSIRKGDWKLVECFPTIDGKHKYSLSLYNLSNDIGETTNLIEKEPSKTNELLQEMYQWRQSTAAPVYDIQMYHTPNSNEIDVPEPWKSKQGDVNHNDLLELAKKWLKGGHL